MYLEGDSPHQTVMFMCDCVWSSYIITYHIMMLLLSCISFTHNTHNLCYIWYYSITRNTYGSICSLNCPNLFWNKIWLDKLMCFWSRNALYLELRMFIYALTCSLNACFDGYLVCIHLVLFLLIKISSSGLSIDTLIEFSILARYLLDTSSSIEIFGFLLDTSR